MRKILAINFSQSGQLTTIVKNIVRPLQDDFSVEHIVYRDKDKFSFPWDKEAFFDAMPETVLNKGVELEEISFKESSYDLIILGYQPWFLSLSQPTTALLQHTEFKKRLKDTPVITVIGARNMWINAQNDAKKFISEAGGKLVGNIPLIDRNPNLISAVTIQYWLFTGKKEKKWNLFPLPGVAQKEIDESFNFGKIIQKSLLEDKLMNLQERLLDTNQFDINWDILFIEARAKKLFRIWANIIVNKGTTQKKRKFWIKIYRNYLFFALFILSPILLLIYALIFRPFLLSSEYKKKSVILHV